MSGLPCELPCELPCSRQPMRGSAPVRTLVP